MHIELRNINPRDPSSTRRKRANAQQIDGNKTLLSAISDNALKLGLAELKS